MITQLADELKKYKRVLPVIVLGAGPSLQKYVHDRAYFKKLRSIGEQEFIVIGVNWVFKSFDVDYNVITHNEPIIEISRGKMDCPLVYSRLTGDVGYAALNYKADGIVFEPFEELWCGQSTIIAALHLATKINPMQVYIAGVDLTIDKKQGMYFDGYVMAGEDRKRPSDVHFLCWAEVVKKQIKGLSNMTGCKFLQYDPK
mgnify:CR=1 FL=1